MNQNYPVPVTFKIQGLEQLKEANREMKRMGGGSGAVAKATRGTAKFGSTAQNASYQVQDLIVQIQGGTDPMRAMSQQLPQMVVGMGAWGAAIGFAAAALPALIVAMSDSTDQAADSKDAIEASAEAWNKYASALDKVDVSGDEADAAIARLLGTIATAQQRSTIQALKGDLDGLVGSVRSMTELPAANTGGGFFGGIMDTLRAANAIGAGGDLAGVAEDTKQLAQAAAELRQFGGLDNLSEFRRIQRELTEENLSQTVVDMTALIESMRGVASPELVSNLEAWVQQLDGARNSADQVSGVLKEIEVTAKRINLDTSQYASPDALKRIEENDYNQGQAIYEAGPNYGSWDEEGAENIRKEVTLAQEAVQAFEQSFDSAVTGIAMGTQDIKSAFQSMVQSIVAQMGKLLAEWLTNMAVQSLFGGSGVTANAQGNVISGGKVTALAKGGVVSGPTIFPMAKGMGLMGEAGPEAVMPLTRMANGNLGVESSGMNVVVNNNAPGVDAIPRQTDNGLTIDIVKRAVAADIARGGNTVSAAIEQSYSLSRGRGLR